MFVDGAAVAGVRRLVQLGELGVEQGEVLLAVLPRPRAQALPLHSLQHRGLCQYSRWSGDDSDLVRKAAASELELQLVSSLAVGGAAGRAAAGVARHRGVREGEPVDM